MAPSAERTPEPEDAGLSTPGGDERVRRLLSVDTVAVLFFCLDGRITDANAAFGRMSGYTRSQLRALRWETLAAPESTDASRRAAEALALNGETGAYEQPLVRKDGSRWWGLLAAKRLAGDGPDAECVAFIIDVTDRNEVARALEEANDWQRLALDAADLGTWKHHVAEDRIELDARAKRHYGLEVDTVALDELLAQIHPADVASARTSIASALDEKTSGRISVTFRVNQPDGRARWLAINGHVRFTRGPDGARPTLAVGTTRDISGQKHAEEVLRDTDRRKDEFLAILAHELRNPLAPVRTAVALLRLPDVPDTVRAHSRDVIERQVAHMARLVDDLLDVARLSQGKLSLQRGPVRLDAVLDAAVETAAPLIQAQQQRLEQRRAPTAVRLEGDLARLSQVFANLLNNAAKYSPANSAIVLEVVARGASVEISIADSGRGIAPEHLARVFDLFAQGGPTLGPSGGLGVGLALARRIVELHGGALTVTSAGPERGATFTVTLPTHANADPVCEDGGAPPSPRRLQRRVLVVDDSVDAADTTALLLKACGCVVRVAYSGEQALHEARVFAPDVVLLDVGMPGMNGLDTCRHLRGLPQGEAFRIIALTGWGQDEDRRRTSSAGFDAHVVKPVAPDDLLDAIGPDDPPSAPSRHPNEQ